MRGRVTEEIKAVAKETLGIEDISTRELRLMPHIQYVMMNEQRLQPRHISPEDREILQRWREAGWIEGGASGLAITKEFWDAINQILWLGYVAYDVPAEAE